MNMSNPVESGHDDNTRTEIPAEILDCLKASNPLFSTHKALYTENCQRCVMAYELRRRGYSVVARPYLPDGADLLPYMNRRYGWPAVFEKQIMTDCSAVSQEQAKENIERQMRVYGNGSRAIVKVDWLNRARGHLFMTENLEGAIYFVDPQTGSADVAWYFQYADPRHVVILRTDCVKFTKLVRLCCE